MRTFLAIAVVLGGVTATRADEADDLLARQLAAVVRDPRLTLPQRIEAVNEPELPFPTSSPSSTDFAGENRSRSRRLSSMPSAGWGHRLA